MGTNLERDSDRFWRTPSELYTPCSRKLAFGDITEACVHPHGSCPCGGGGRWSGVKDYRFPRQLCRGQRSASMLEPSHSSELVARINAKARRPFKRSWVHADGVLLGSHRLRDHCGWEWKRAGCELAENRKRVAERS